MFQWLQKSAKVQTLDKGHALVHTKYLVQKLWWYLAFRLTAVSTGMGAAGFISMTEPSKLVEKAIGRPNTTWNSVKSELFPRLCLASLDLQLLHIA